MAEIMFSDSEAAISYARRAGGVDPSKRSHRSHIDEQYVRKPNYSRSEDSGERCRKDGFQAVSSQLSCQDHSIYPPSQHYFWEDFAPKNAYFTTVRSQPESTSVNEGFSWRPRHSNFSMQAPDNSFYTINQYARGQTYPSRIQKARYLAETGPIPATSDPNTRHPNSSLNRSPRSEHSDCPRFNYSEDPYSSQNSSPTYGAITASPKISDIDISHWLPMPVCTPPHSPAVTSSRRSWQAYEDDMLLQAVKSTRESFGDPIPWTKVSAIIPDRSPTMCSKRFRVLMSQSDESRTRLRHTKGPWDAEEDENLLRILAEYTSSGASPPGVIPWSKIGSLLDKPRTGLQACARYTEALDPTVTRGRWSKEEDKILTEEFLREGPRWSSICEKIAGRTQRQCASRWNVLEKRHNPR